MDAPEQEAPHPPIPPPPPYRSIRTSIRVCQLVCKVFVHGVRLLGNIYLRFITKVYRRVSLTMPMLEHEQSV